MAATIGYRRRIASGVPDVLDTMRCEAGDSSHAEPLIGDAQRSRWIEELVEIAVESPLEPWSRWALPWEARELVLFGQIAFARRAIRLSSTPSTGAIARHGGPCGGLPRSPGPGVRRRPDRIGPQVFAMGWVEHAVVNEGRRSG